MILLDASSFFDTKILGEQVANYMWFAGIILATILFKKYAAQALASLSAALARRLGHGQKEFRLQGMIAAPLERLIQLVLYYIAAEQLSGLLNRLAWQHPIGKNDELVIRLSDIVDHIFVFLFILFLSQIATRLIDYYAQLELEKAQRENNQERVQLLPLIKEMSKLLLWTLSTFWVLGSVFHVNVPAMITGLGIGGVAIALAGKQTVENFFAAFTILTDKPFQTGEVIKIGDLEGTVEKIGFRSTRLRSADGSAYIIPNQNLVSQNVINLTQRDTKGMKLVVNVKYGLQEKLLEQMLAELKKMVQDTLHIIEPVQVSVEGFGAEVFQVVISYHLPTPLPADANEDAIRQKINLNTYNIVAKFSKMQLATG